MAGMACGHVVLSKPRVTKGTFAHVVARCLKADLDGLWISLERKPQGLR